MYSLRRFHGPRFGRLNAIIDSLAGYISSYVNLVGSATLPFPEVCQMEGLPGTACRVEGHLHARMFPSTHPVDEAEAVIEELTKQLFDLDDSYSVSGQPHSATQANHAVLRAVLDQEDKTVACLSTTDGGHISHRFGAPPNTDFISVPLAPLGIDYDALEKRLRSSNPHLIIVGGTSYPRAVDYPRLREMAERVGGHLHADLAHTAPFVAGGAHPPAFPYVDSATIDTNKNLRGPSGGILIYREKLGPAVRRAIFPILQSSPHPTGLMAKAACLVQWSDGDMTAYANRMVHSARILAAALEPYLGVPVFGGTDSHLLLFDLTPTSLDGREAERILDESRILVNRNQIPGDKKSPWIASGIRLGSTVPAILEYDERDIAIIGESIGKAVVERADVDEAVDAILNSYHHPIISTSNGST